MDIYFKNQSAKSLHFAREMFTHNYVSFYTVLSRPLLRDLKDTHMEKSILK